MSLSAVQIYDFHIFLTVKSRAVMNFYIIRLYFYKLILRERETKGVKGTSKSAQ